MTNADSIKIESDERGFELHLTVDEEPIVDEQGRMVVNIHGCAVDLLREVQKHIAPWWEEGEKVQREFLRHAFLCKPDESCGQAKAEYERDVYDHERMTGQHSDDGYETGDPKHPDFHSIHADIWDSREGK